MPPLIKCLNFKVDFFTENLSSKNHFKECVDPMDVNSQHARMNCFKIFCICWQPFNSFWHFIKHNTTCTANFAEALGYPKPKTPVYYFCYESYIKPEVLVSKLTTVLLPYAWPIICYNKLRLLRQTVLYKSLL